MFPQAIQLVFFWRRNHLPSIAFKCAIWGSAAWIVVGLIATNQLALLAAISVGTMSAVKYGLRNRQQSEKLRHFCEGDPQMLADLNAKMNTPGVAGTLLREMLNAEVNDDQNSEYADSVPPTAQELQANSAFSTQLIKKMARLTRASELAAGDECIDVEIELLSAYGSGEYKIAIDELVSEFLPNNLMSIYSSDYGNDDDHASLVDQFSAATNGIWNTENCRSRFDQNTQQWIVSFKENGKQVSWQFKQDADKGLSEEFLQRVINYVEMKSGYTVSILNTGPCTNLVCLPSGMYTDLTGISVEMVA